MKSVSLTTLAEEHLTIARAASAGRSAKTVHGAHELDLPKRYRNIIVCGGFGLGGVRAHDQEALRRFHSHLEPGGNLLIDNYVPYRSASEWHFWTEAGQKELPAPWPESGSRKVAANGDEIELLGRLTALDTLDQVATRELRARLWRGGEMVTEENHVLKERLYFRNELVGMLQAAGFESVTVREGYSDDEPTTTTGILVYHAIR